MKRKIMAYLMCMTLIFTLFQNVVYADIGMQPLNTVTFNDPVLEAQVRKTLGKQPSDEITITDMQGITRLSFYGSTPISDLTGLEYCTSLKELTIVSSPSLSSLEPIKDLPLLTEIMVLVANVEDISILFQDPSKVYERVSLSSLPIKDFSCLNGAKIKNLSISSTSLDFVPMLDESALPSEGAVLELTSNKITDISNLNTFNKISKINLTGNNITDTSPLLNLANATEVKIDFSNSGYISGYVKDDTTSNPIENAIVEVEGVGAKVSTDYSGYFTMQVPSNCSVLVSKTGYIPYQFDFDRWTNNPMYIDLIDNSKATDTEYKGKLLDYITGQPLDGVTITAAETGQSTTTNDKGEFSLILKQGVYNMTFSKTGYKSKTLKKVLNSFNDDTVYLETDTVKKVVEIKNSDLKEEIKKALIPFGQETDQITTDHLALLKVFKARDCYSSNEDLEVLKYMTNLEKLFIIENFDGRITDLSAIKDLTKLDVLFIRGQHITDLSPLENLTNLKGLAIMNYPQSPKGQLSDISVLRNLTNLRLLSLSNNSIKDISPLENLDNLVRVDLSKNHIENIDSLKKVVENINSGKDGNINDSTYNSDFELELVFSPFYIPKTFNVILHDNRISDISPLNGMNELSLVDFTYNFIRDFKSVENITGFQPDNYRQKETRAYVHYKDNTFKDLLPTETIMNLPLGDTTVNAQDIDGYTPITSTETITFDPTRDKGCSYGGLGVYQIEVMEYNVYFSYREQLKTGTIITQYVDDKNNQIAPDTVQIGLPMGTHTLYSKTINGYTLNDTPVKTATLNTDGEVITVTFRYKKNEIAPPPVLGSIQIVGENEKGEEIYNNLESNKVLGTHTILAPIVPGYILNDSQTKEITLTAVNKDQIVKFVFRTPKGSIVTRYVDDKNSSIAPDTVLNDLELGTYKTNSKEIKGYTLNDTEIKTAILNTDGQVVTITFTYKKNEEPPVIPPIPVDPPTPTDPPVDPPKKKGIIKGQVRKQGKPLEEAEVMALGTNLDPKVTKTDENGNYEFKNLNFGEYVLILKADDIFTIKMIVVQ